MHIPRTVPILRDELEGYCEMADMLGNRQRFSDIHPKTAEEKEMRLDSEAMLGGEQFSYVL